MTRKISNGDHSTLTHSASGESREPKAILRSRKALREVGHEYASVARATSQPLLLIEAHETSMSKQDAEALLEILAEDCGRTRPKVTWGKRAWARPERNHIQLPQSGHDLNVGTVVHEFAHLVAPEAPRVAGRRRHHDAGFVAALDKLLAASYSLWTTDAFDLEASLRIKARPTLRVFPDGSTKVCLMRGNMEVSFRDDSIDPEE